MITAHSQTLTQVFPQTQLIVILSEEYREKDYEVLVGENALTEYSEYLTVTLTVTNEDGSEVSHDNHLDLSVTEEAESTVVKENPHLFFEMKTHRGGYFLEEETKRGGTLLVTISYSEADALLLYRDPKQNDKVISIPLRLEQEIQVY